MKRRRAYPTITWSESKRLFRATLPANEYRAKRKEVYGDTKDEVMDRIDLIEAQEEKGVSSATSLQDVALRWFKLKVVGKAPKTKEAYNNALVNHILPQFGPLPISEIRPLHIDELLASMEGKSSSLQRKVLNTINQVMEMAHENDLITKNPCRNKRAGGEKVKEKVPLTTEQQTALMKATKGTRAELFVPLCLYAGLRREEALGLLWRDVHLDQTPYIDVRNTVTFESNGRSTFSDKLKSKAAYRTIPIPPQLSTLLKESRKSAPSVYVVYSATTHQHMTRSSYVKMWKRITGYTYRTKDEKGEPVEHKVNGLVDFPVHAHLLRHTYITELCSSGMPVKEVQYLAGHETAQMTLDVYAKVKENRPEQLGPKVISAFSAGKPAGNKKRKVAK